MGIIIIACGPKKIYHNGVRRGNYCTVPVPGAVLYLTVDATATSACIAHHRVLGILARARAQPSYGKPFPFPGLLKPNAGLLQRVSFGPRIGF